MRNRIFSSSEAMTIAANLNKIEMYLGKPIPGGMIDMTEYKDDILSSSEAMTIAANLNKVSHYKGRSRIEDIFMYVFVLAIFAILFYEFILL